MSGGNLAGYVLSMQDVTERIQFENDLQAREERFRLVADYTTDLELWTGPDGDIRYISPSCEAITGFGPSSFYEDPDLILKIIHPDDRAVWDDHVMAGHQSHERVVDFRITSRSGEERWISHNCRPVYTDDGTWMGYRSSNRDITDRKHVEQALRESEGKLRALVDNLPVGVSVLDETRQLQLVNPALGKILQLSRDELMQGYYTRRTYLRADGAQMNSSEFPSTRAFVENLPVHDIEIQVITAEGQSIWTSVSAIPLPYSDWRVILTTNDITSQKQAQIAVHQANAALESRVLERTQQLSDLNNTLVAEIAERHQTEVELRASEERFRQVAENINQILLLINPLNGQLLYVNPIYEQIWGQFLKPVPDHVDAILDYTYPEDRERMNALLHSREVIEDDIRIQLPDGDIRWLRCHIFPLKNEDGELYRTAGIFEDITQKKRALDALVEAEKLSLAGKMATSLAHEINNPLQAAMGCLELAQEQLARGEDAHEFLLVTAEALLRASRIVSQLRTLHQPAVPEMKVRTSLNTLLDKVKILTMKKCEDNAINVIVDKDADLPDVLVMPNAIQQVFLNVILNAVDAMPDGGTLRVITSQTSNPPGCQIEFRDSGGGIPASILQGLFEPFATTKRNSLGLGLFISRNIVIQNGGRMDVQSPQGSGAIFTVWLPLQEIKE